MKTKKTALTIAGSDPTGGAGIQADLRTFQSMGVYGLSLPTVLTAQSTERIVDIQEISTEFLSLEIDTLLKDTLPDALKTGLLYTADVIGLVTDKVREYRLGNVVVDPIIASSTGVPLMKGDAISVMKTKLFPIARVVTPNINEAALLTGLDIRNEHDIKEAATRISSMGPETVIITGGHMPGNAIDTLFDGQNFLSLENVKLQGVFHGTGCVFSAAVTACLALGYDMTDAFIKARDFISESMHSAFCIGRGMNILNT